jgi:hypothetical protein
MVTVGDLNGNGKPNLARCSGGTSPAMSFRYPRYQRDHGSLFRERGLRRLPLSALTVSARKLSTIMFCASPKTQMVTMSVVFTGQVNCATTGGQTGTVSS